MPEEWEMIKGGAEHGVLAGKAPVARSRAVLTVQKKCATVGVFFPPLSFERVGRAGLASNPEASLGRGSRVGDAALSLGPHKGRAKRQK